MISLSFLIQVLNKVIQVIVVLVFSMVKIEIGITALKAIGFSFEISVLFAIIWSLIVTTLEYFSVTIIKDKIDEKLAKRKNHSPSQTEKIWKEKIRAPIEKKRKKFLKFLLDHQVSISLLIVLIPFTFFLDPIAISAIRLSKKKYGLFLLLVATLGESLLTIFLIY